MSALSIPYSIANGQATDGNKVGANFTAIKSWADTYAAELTNVTTRHDSGASGARPAASSGLRGMVWYDTTTTTMWLCNGTSWVPLGWGSAAGRKGYIGLFSVAGSDGQVLNATPKQLFFGTETLDSDGFATAGTSNVLTIPAGLGGIYAVEVDCDMALSGLGSNPYIQVTQTGSVAKGYAAPGVSVLGSYSWGGILHLADGDTLSVKLYQDSGGTKTLSSSFFRAIYLGA